MWRERWRSLKPLWEQVVHLVPGTYQYVLSWSWHFSNSFFRTLHPLGIEKVVVRDQWQDVSLPFLLPFAFAHPPFYFWLMLTVLAALVLSLSLPLQPSQTDLRPTGPSGITTGGRWGDHGPCQHLLPRQRIQVVGLIVHRLSSDTILAFAAEGSWMEPLICHQGSFLPPPGFGS